MRRVYRAPTPPRTWKKLELRGCGTDAGGKWEAVGRKAIAAPMPDVRLLNRLVHYLTTSGKALEFKADQKKAKVSQGGRGGGRRLGELMVVRSQQQQPQEPLEKSVGIGRVKGHVCG